MNPNLPISKKTSPQEETGIANRKIGELFSLIGLSLLFAVFLMGSLIYFAGAWEIAANTRILDLFIKSGIVKYHDRQAGFIEGLPDPVLYLKSQEPVAWVVVLIVIAILMLFWVLKSYQFHEIARYNGISGTFGQNAHAYLIGSLTYKKFLPLHGNKMAKMAELRAGGATADQIYSTLFLFQLFIVFEIIAYSLLSLLSTGTGWSAWLLQLSLAIVVFSMLYWWTRPSDGGAKQISFLSASKVQIKKLLQRPSLLIRLCLLSLVAFGLMDISAYLLTMAFSTQQVLLHADFGVLLMAFVAGYIARQIPLTPGGIGQFEWAFAAALFLGGMGLPEAATVTLLYSFFYYLSMGILYLLTLSWRGTRASFQTVGSLLYNPPPVNGKVNEASSVPIARESAFTDTPAVPRFFMPKAFQVWSRALIIFWMLLGLFFFDRLSLLLSDLWLLKSLDFREVFYTNFRMGAILFTIGTLAFTAAVAGPAWLYELPGKTRRFILRIAGIEGLLAGYLLALQYQDYLLWLNGRPFGQADPVFHQDIGFYVFSLPGLWTTWWVFAWFFGVNVISCLVCAYLSSKEKSPSNPAPLQENWFLTQLMTTPTLVAIAGSGLVLAAGFWLARYQLLLKEDELTSVFTGASYLDVNGLFSTLNHMLFTTVVTLLCTGLAIFILRTLHKRWKGSENPRWAKQIRFAWFCFLTLIIADFAFALSVSIRDTIWVTPNQPVVQLPYIERHIDATRHAFGLDRIEEVEFRPRGGDIPIPEADRMLSSSTVKNAPLWPPFVNYLEQLIDPQHAQRILQTGGDDMIYGPTLEVFQQYEKLRTYYDFMDVDALRYTIDGEKIVFASSVRELPILEPQPWLAWWGQRFMLFTHGYGLVTAPVGQVTDQGEPIFVNGQIPAQTVWSEIAATNPQVYYGEGNASTAVSNVRDMAELDYPTDQGRAENVLSADFAGGVKINSLLKRIVFGWRSGEFWQMIFSHLITSETRAHFNRQPLKRLQSIAPFLYFEANPYPTISEGDITWLVNAVTISDQYPYSKHEFIGDKSLSRSAERVTTKRINYVEDAVKASINASTGMVRLYKIADKPLINTWAAIYPDLFTDADQMPVEINQQLTYPLQLFHLLFDDLYIYYHMNDPMYFFNMEDMWDDADEVLGPVLDQGKAITFSMEPYHMVLETGGSPIPAAAEKEQFVMTMPFTPEGARNLRAIPMVYQDGEDYGRLFVLTIPKGMFVMGPEQADAIIDQDPDISSQISWWNRRGTEVIRGHTSLLLIDNEIIYIEPIFIRSQQNSIPQLKRVVAVVRGKAYMAENLEKALLLAQPSEPISQHSPKADLKSYSEIVNIEE